MPRAKATSGISQQPIEQLRHENIGRLLIDSFRVFEEMVLTQLRAAGFADIRLVHTSLLRNVDIEGTRISDVVYRSNLTKQMIGQLIQECERLGYVRRDPDPSDGRAKTVVFTKRGEALLAVISTVMDHVTSDISGALGPRQFDALRRTLKRFRQIEHTVVEDPGADAPSGRRSVKRQPRKSAGR